MNPNRRAVLGITLLLLGRAALTAQAKDSAGPRVTHFRLCIVIDDQTQSVAGTAEFQYVSSGATSETLSFIQRGLRIEKVEAEPHLLRDYRVVNDALEMNLAGAKTSSPGQVRIHYRAQPQEGLFFHRTNSETGIPVEQVWQFQAWRFWMPQPQDDSALLTWELEAEVRPDWQVVSNGELVSVAAREKRRVFHWRQFIPARFDGFTFAAGNFDVFEQREEGRRFLNYVPARVSDAATVARSLGRAPNMLQVFSREFGPYPFGDFRQVVLWDYHPQGTEHLGLSCLSENKLIDERSRLDADDYIVAHELVHNWWWVLVEPTSRAHIWLSEGFAVYFGNQYFEIAEGRDEFQHRLRRRLRLYLDEDRKYRRVLVSDDPVPGELDEHIYSKGAYILHMLRRYIGDDHFFAGMHRFAERHAFGRADSTGLQRAMEDVSGLPLGWYFQQWLYQKGYPVFRVGRKWDEQSRILTLEVEQVQDASAGSYRVPVRIQVVDEGGSKTYDEIFSGKKEERTYRLESRLRYVRFDSDNRLLAVVDFPRPAEELLGQLTTSEDALGRIEAIEALARMPGSEITTALERALRFDLFHGVRSAAALSLALRGEASIPTLIQALRAETDSRVQQNIVVALESFAGRIEVQTALKQVALSLPSAHVRGKALLALARAKAGGTFELLMAALRENAHRDVLRAAALQGFSALEDVRAVPEIIQYLRSDRTTRWAREPAVEALGKLGKNDVQATQVLERLRANDFWPGVREAARRALEPVPSSNR